MDAITDISEELIKKGDSKATASEKLDLSAGAETAETADNHGADCEIPAIAPEPKQDQLPPADEPEEPVIPLLPLPDPISDFRGCISAFGFSQQGESHLKKDTPCQDRSSVRFLSDSVVIAAIADGVGSCVLSDYGAATAVESSLDFLEKILGSKLEDPSFQMDVPFMGKLLREMMQYSYDQVRAKADEMEQLLYSLQSTLTIAVFDGITLYFAHAGDDGIVALTQEGKYEMVTTRHKGDEASSVYPLQNTNTWQYGKVENVVGFVMATDGVLDAFVRNESEENRVYFPFIEPAFTASMSCKAEVASECNDWYTYMKGPKYRASVTDDLSFVCIVNQAAIKGAKKPDFDMNEWNKKSREYEERRRAALYPFASQKTASDENPPKEDRNATPTSGASQRPPQEAASNNASVSQQPHACPAPDISQDKKTDPDSSCQSTPPSSASTGSTPVQQNASNNDDKATKGKMLKYGKKAMESVGNILIAGGELLRNFGRKASPSVKERSGNSKKESRDQTSKPTNPNSPKNDNNGDTDGNNSIS